VRGGDHPISTVRVLISCPDQPAIVAAVSEFLFEAGADIERRVLARAVPAHCQDRGLRHGNATVVF
jgi:formyltetrahydrofolate hydrolase